MGYSKKSSQTIKDDINDNQIVNHTFIQCKVNNKNSDF